MSFLKDLYDANLGDFESEYKVGIRYLHGIGIDKNEEKAFNYFNRSAYQGYVKAQISLAWMYYDGIYVDQNICKSFIRFKVAADDEDNGRAQMMVGLMYEYGEGEKLNLEKALKYYKRAAKNKNSDALEKLKYYKHAAKNKNSDALEKLNDII